MDLASVSAGEMTENTTEERKFEKRAPRSRNSSGSGAMSRGGSNSGSNGHGSSYQNSYRNESDDFQSRDQGSMTDRPRMSLEVPVEQNIEKAMRVLKRKLIREGVFKELKVRRYYEKPCEKRKRKHKESVKRIRKEESRQRKFANGLF